MSLITFFTSLVSTLSLAYVGEFFYALCLTIDGVIYSLLSYAFELFMLMCQLNFSSLEAIIAPLIDRVQAVVMVFIVFKLGVTLVEFLLKPEDAPKNGGSLVKNIFIVAALLVSYNLVFNILNELSMLIIGVPEGYSFTTLSRIADITDNEDEGLIFRFVFGSESEVEDIGDFIAFETLSMFVRDTTSETVLSNTISSGDEYDFTKLPDIVSKLKKTVEYTPGISGLMGIYLIYCVVLIAIDIGIRMFKLLVLQIIAPIAIISILKDNGRSLKENKIFNNYCNKYVSTYISAFIRILSMLIVNVFICQFILKIRVFFGETAMGTNGMTRILLTLIVMVAGYKFAMEAPKFIDSIFGTKLAGGDTKNFGSFLGTTLGVGVGATAGAVGGFATGLATTGKFGTALANAGAGLFSGGSAGYKGNSIADKVKNITSDVKKSGGRAQGWAANGGAFATLAGSALAATGVKNVQDRQMQKIEQQEAAIKSYEEATKAYEEAQINAIKGNHMDENAMLKMRDSDGNMTTRTANNIYSDGYQNITLGTDANDYASRMLEYDKEYQDAQAKLQIAQREGDAYQIAQAQTNLTQQKNISEKRAADYYNSQKNSASGEKVDEARSGIDKARENVNVSLGREKGSTLDLKATKQEIADNKKTLQEKSSYKYTHNGQKKK